MSAPTKPQACTVPFVRLHVGQSVDGKLAAPGQGKHAMGGRADVRAMARCRAWADAVLVGAETIRTLDVPCALTDPALQAARQARGLTAVPRALVLCGSGELPSDARWLRPGPEAACEAGSETEARTRAEAEAGAAQDNGTSTAKGKGSGDGPIRAFVAVGAGAKLSPQLEARVEVWRSRCPCPGVPHTGKHEVCITGFLQALAARGIARLLVEGGGATAWSFAAAGALDEVQCTLAPWLLGGAAGPTMIAGPGFAWPARVRLRLTQVRTRHGLVFLRYRVRCRRARALEQTSATQLPP